MSTFQFLQSVLVFLFALSLIAVLVFADILYRNLSARRQPFFAALTGSCVVHLGAMICYGWLWGWRYYGGDEAVWMSWPNVSIFFLGLGLTAFGTACLLRVFSYERYGHWSWLVAIFASAAVAVYLGF